MKPCLFDPTQIISIRFSFLRRHTFLFSFHSFTFLLGCRIGRYQMFSQCMHAMNARHYKSIMYERQVTLKYPVSFFYSCKSQIKEIKRKLDNVDVLVITVHYI